MTEKRLATKRQTWALFCITKQDYRKINPEMTYDEASQLIEKFNAEKGYTAKPKAEKTPKVNKALEIHNQAYAAGIEALNGCTPDPMVVVDEFKPEKQWFVSDGVCGFAWVHFKATTKENRSFLAGLKKAGLATDGYESPWKKDTYRGGYQLWVREGGQSMQKKEAFARAYADVLGQNGINCFIGSRMD